jgi:hypothetical protein
MSRRYVIGSGWWCANPQGTEEAEKGHKKWGDRFIRSVAFHEVWKRYIFQYTNPVKIVIVDSASPFKPEIDARLEWISLDRNYQPLATAFNGWIRGFLTGAWYAWNCSCDFIYVEQDCLALGAWVDAIYKKTDGKHPMYGGYQWGGHKLRSWVIQQSLVFLPVQCIPRWLYLVTQDSTKMACEKRFISFRKTMPYQTLPFGYGRIRPLRVSDSVFYAQHMNRKELLAIAKREGDKELSQAFAIPEGK